MPWLLTNVTFDREVEEIAGADGSFTIATGGENRIAMTMIDTDQGKVTEVQYNFMGGIVKERAPKMAEVAEAERALNKDAMGQADKLVQAERRASKRREDELLANLKERDERIKELEQRPFLDPAMAATPPVAQMEPIVHSGHVFTGNQQNMLSAALCYYLDFLAEDDQTEGIHVASELHRQITGVLPPEPS